MKFSLRRLAPTHVAPSTKDCLRTVRGASKCADPAPRDLRSGVSPSWTMLPMKPTYLWFFR